MACFIVPTAEAVITTIVEKKAQSVERKEVAEHIETEQVSHKIPFSHKLKWLNSMLIGGSALLAFEHVWHGEVVPFFPFLTAASNAQDAAEMLHEMATTGVTMAALVTAVWGVMVLASSVIEKRTETESEVEEA